MTGPARTLAAQADALACAAAFIKRAGLAGLTIAVTGEHITILVSGTLPAAAQIAAVTTLAAAIGAPAPDRAATGTWTHITATGTISGHPARVWASLEPEDPAA